MTDASPGELPFGEMRRVRYQDGAGNVRTVRAKLMKPDSERHPSAVVLLEISAPSDDGCGAYLPLQGWQLAEISPLRPPALPPSPDGALWYA
jgi:hypothetical protein